MELGSITVGQNSEMNDIRIVSCNIAALLIIVCDQYINNSNK